MDDIILIGSGGHARACIDVIELSGEFKVAGFVEKDKATRKSNLGYPLIGSDADLQKIIQKYRNVLIGVGQIKSPKSRIKLFDLLKKIGYRFPTIVSPKAYVSKQAHVGEGTIVMHDAMVNTNSIVGKNCIINNKSLIEHDTTIGDHCHVSTGVIMNGQVRIGEGCLIGSGAIISNSITIGNNCIIGAGVVVKNDVKAKQIIKH